MAAASLSSIWKKIRQSIFKKKKEQQWRLLIDLQFLSFGPWASPSAPQMPGKVGRRRKWVVLLYFFGVITRLTYWNCAFNYAEQPRARGELCSPLARSWLRCALLFKRAEGRCRR